MTLILDLDLDVLKLHLHIKSEVSRSKPSKIRTRTGHTDRQTDATESSSTHHWRVQDSDSGNLMNNAHMIWEIL